jgi:hypothetical protein
MGANSKRAKEQGIRTEAGWIVSAVEVGRHSQTGLSCGGTKEVENLLLAVQRFGGPILGDFRKPAMFDGIPFGSARRIVSHRHGEIEGVGELRLEFGLPGMAPTTIAATGVGEKEELAGATIAERAFPFPPTRDGRSSEGGGIVRDSEKDGAAIGQQIVDAVRNGHTGGVRAEVVVIDQYRRAIPLGAGVVEVAHQFALFGIHADHRKTATLEAMAQRGEVLKLLVAEGAGVGGEIFAMGPQREIHVVE